VIAQYKYAKSSVKHCYRMPHCLSNDFYWFWCVAWPM